PTLVETDLSRESAAATNVVRHFMNAAGALERIYAKQKGVFDLEAKVPEADTSSRMMFYRNQSPFCEAPQTENNPACSALAMKPPRISGLYPAAIQADPKFCEAVAKAPNAQDLMGHFNIVVNGEKPDRFKPLAYNEAYKEDMQAVASELEAAAEG